MYQDEPPSSLPFASSELNFLKIKFKRSLRLSVTKPSIPQTQAKLSASIFKHFSGHEYKASVTLLHIALPQKESYFYFESDDLVLSSWFPICTL